MTIPTDVLVALIGGSAVIFAAVIAGVATIIGHKIGNVRKQVERVHSEVTPNHGESAHDKLIQEIQNVEKRRVAALADHEQRLHGARQ